MTARIDTELARLELVSPNLVVAYLEPDIRITAGRAQEVRQARHTLVSGVPVAMLVVARGDLRWESSVLDMDFLAPAKDRIKALAVVVHGSFLYSVANLYFALNPGKCPVKLVDTVEAGYAWLAQQGFVRSSMEGPAVA